MRFETGRALGALGATAFLVVPLAAAGAQAGDPTRIRVLNRDCERARGGDEIVVCGQREPRSRFRLPEEPDRGFDPTGAAESVSRERNALTEAGAASGIGSCSPIGPGGYTGCRAREFRGEIEQYRGDPPRLGNGFHRRRR